MKALPYGDGALYVDLELGETPDRASRTHAVAAALRTRLPDVDVVVGAGSIAVVGLGAWDDVEGLVIDAMHDTGAAERSSRTFELETVYDGPDLDDVARLAGLSAVEVVEIHASRDYLVELVGFLPGFAYLAAVDSRIVVPRRATPRPRVERGSVGLAGPYTGVYPLASPGGWQLIGRAVGVDLFDAQRDRPALLSPGDRVRFVPVRTATKSFAS